MLALHSARSLKPTSFKLKKIQGLISPQVVGRIKRHGDGRAPRLVGQTASNLLCEFKVSERPSLKTWWGLERWPGGP